MSKTLKELADDLKEYIISSQSDAHNKITLRPERYNNLSLKMDILKNRQPHVIISLSLSQLEVDLKTGEKYSGGLGPDERYTLRWLARPNTIPALMECWKKVEKNLGKAYEKEV